MVQHNAFFLYDNVIIEKQPVRWGGENNEKKRSPWQNNARTKRGNNKTQNEKEENENIHVCSH